MSSSRFGRLDLPPAWVSEVADSVFAYIQPDGGWWINNAGFIAGQHTVVSLDTSATEQRTRAYLAKVEEITGQVPHTLVNTHHHGDHTNGNYLLPFATVIGHYLCREEILRTGIMQTDGLFEPVDWGALVPAPPFVTFENRLDLYVDDLKIELIHLTAAAHTTNDVVAWIPQHRVLFSGDLIFNGGTPFVIMGSVAGSIEALAAVAELEPDLIVPGHGAPGGIEMVNTCGSYLRWLQQSAGQAFEAGLSPLEAARELDLGDFAGLRDPERLVGNLHRALAECQGARPGAPIDLQAAFADMIAFNDGRPLSCRA